MGKYNFTEILAHKVVIREKGYLYYIDKEGNICRTLTKAKIKELEENKK